MKKVREKYGSMVCILVVVVMALAIKSSAMSEDEHGIRSMNARRLNYWFCDIPFEAGVYVLGRFDTPVITLQSYKLNTNGSFGYNAAMENARMQWENAIDVPINTVSSSNAKIQYLGGTVEELVAFGVSDVDSSVAGMTGIYCDDDTEDWIYANTTVEAKVHTATIGYIIDRGNANYVNVCVHEMGHALGWHGHSSQTADIMHPSSSSPTTLTNRDILQISQAYNRSDY